MRRTKVIPYKRQLRHKTNYRRRMNLLAGNVPRLVVRKSINNINAQLVNFGQKGDHIVASAHSTELRKYGWEYSLSNTPSAYLTGLLIGHRAAYCNIKKAVLDLGLSRSVSGSTPYALLKGALDAGLDIPHSKDMLPDESRILGKHVVEYSKHAKLHQFSHYKKENIALADIPQEFDHIKSKILKEEHGKKERK